MEKEPGKDVLERRIVGLTALFGRAPIAKTFGMELSYNSGGEAEFRLPYNPHLDSPVGIHGGVMSTMLDMAGWFTVATRYDTWISTVDLHVQLLQHAKERGIRASAKIVRAGARLSMATMELHTDDGTLVAIGSATFTVTSVSYKDGAGTGPGSAL